MINHVLIETSNRVQPNYVVRRNNSLFMISWSIIRTKYHYCFESKVGLGDNEQIAVSQWRPRALQQLVQMFKCQAVLCAVLSVG